MKLTDHFSLVEFTRSQTATRHGIDNTPPPGVLTNLHRLASVLERIREIVGRKSVIITSGYRCPQLNYKVGGSRTSAHMDGRAADIVVRGMSPYALAKAVKASDVVLDQLILEFGEWVHVGINRFGDVSRGDVMTAKIEQGRAVYLPGLVEDPKNG